MRRALALLFALVLPSACRLSPADPIEAAAKDVRRGRIFAALDRLDRLPASHVRYEQGRRLAQALERRLRASYEKLLEGLALRDEWRDEEAVSRFQEALEIWPDIRGARGLIRATESRIAALGGDRPAAWQRVVGLETREVGVVNTRTFDGREPRSRADARPARRVVESERRQRLRRDAALCIRQGRMERATRILGELVCETPGDRRLKAELARVQHQRALLAYGQGQLAQAIALWQRVLELTPDDAKSQAFLQTAQREAATRER